MKTRNRTVRLLFVLATVLVATAALAPAFAQEGGVPDVTAAAAVGMYAKFGAAIGAGMVVIGAGLGIGKFAAAAADGVARQPQAAAQITGAVQLPLFLLEGVAIIGVVTCLLISFS